MSPPRPTDFHNRICFCRHRPVNRVRNTSVPTTRKAFPCSSTGRDANRRSSGRPFLTAGGATDRSSPDRMLHSNAFTTPRWFGTYRAITAAVSSRRRKESCTMASCHSQRRLNISTAMRSSLLMPRFPATFSRRTLPISSGLLATSADRGCLHEALRKIFTGNGLRWVMGNSASVSARQSVFFRRVWSPVDSHCSNGVVVP